jgi:hypothetical protein
VGDPNLALVMKFFSCFCSFLPSRAKVGKLHPSTKSSSWSDLYQGLQVKNVLL